VVGAPRQELVEKVAVGGAYLDTGEARVDGAAGGGGEVGHGFRQAGYGWSVRHAGTVEVHINVRFNSITGWRGAECGSVNWRIGPG
jgi:hypothetical protein